MSNKLMRTILSIALCGICGALGGLAALGAARGTDFGRFWPVYLTYLVFAGGIGILNPNQAWIAGAVIMPVHWIVVIGFRADPITSTIGVGHFFTIVLSVPLALASHLGGRVARTPRRGE